MLMKILATGTEKIRTMQSIDRLFVGASAETLAKTKRRTSYVAEVPLGGTADHRRSVERDPDCSDQSEEQVGRRTALDAQRQRGRDGCAGVVPTNGAECVDGN
jgi:hypothetical protein